mgnify:CR=1 FL=1
MDGVASSTNEAPPASDYWDGFIPEADAADYLCQSIRTLQKWRVNGRGPAYFKPGKSVRYRRRDLREWTEARRRRHTAEA